MLSLIGKYCKDCHVMIDNIETDAMTLIYSILNTKEFENAKIRIMPDCHSGKGIVIGFTAPITDAVNPSHVGVDIGCTITTYITDKEINNDEIPIIEHRIKNAIPSGCNVHKQNIIDEKIFFHYLQTEYNKAVSSWQDRIEYVDINEKFISRMLSRIGMDEGLFYKSIGTLGGGNHFIEIGNCDGKYAFTVHCGSRNFGNKVCRYWEKIAASNKIDKKLFKEKVAQLKKTVDDKHKIPELIKQLKNEEIEKTCTVGYLCGDNLNHYLSDMVIAQAYAKYNHLIIGNLIKDIFFKINQAKIVETIQSIHNYIDITGDHMIRKGAIRAYEGEKMVVPFNMRDGIAICIGKSNAEWNYSCSHGARRVMSRAKAKSVISMSDFKDSMKGIYSTSICPNTIDEAPMAYKKTETIISLIKDTCDILCFIKPIINIKATDEHHY